MMEFFTTFVEKRMEEWTIKTASFKPIAQQSLTTITKSPLFVSTFEKVSIKLTTIDALYFDCRFTRYYRTYYPLPEPIIVIIEEPETWQSKVASICSNWYFLSSLLFITCLITVSVVWVIYRG